MSFGTVIIGNGISGITTARHIRKRSDQRIQVISSETPYFFSRTALMYVYMGHMKFEHTQPYENWFWEKNRIELIQARVETVNPESKSIKLNTGEEIFYDDLVIATGSRSRYFGWKGQDLKGVQGLFSAQDLDLLEENGPAPYQRDHRTKKAVIVGAGLIGVELAEMLRTRDIEVTMLVRDSYFWGNVITANEGEWINKHIQDHHVKLLFNTELDEILGDHDGRVRAIRTKEGEELDCQIVGITTGVQANIEFLKETGIELNRGILVNEFLESSLTNIYAIGDCAEVRNPVEGRRPMEPVWYVGRMMGEALGASLAGAKTAYKPGPWFNSAKFFDIEYQTYGVVSAKENENQKHFFWKWEGRNKFITVAYHPETLEFQGINTFGIRMRHEYFDKVLKEKWEVGVVMSGLSKANFDPEFSKKWINAFTTRFTQETAIKIKKIGLLKSLV